MDKAKHGFKYGKTTLRALAYLLAVLLVFLTFSVLCTDDAVPVEPAGQPGHIDLRDFDFANQTAKLAVNWKSVYIYPGAFFTAEDFASGSVTRQGNLRPPYGDYGTMRLVLRLPPGAVYAIAAKSVSYAQRLFVDGVEIGAVGHPTDNATEHIPMNRRYAQGFYAAGETTEIIIHYAVFVHADGGGLYPMLIGSVANVVRAEQLRILFEGVLSAALFTAMLFFFGLFLFFGARRYFLWFSLLCGCIALLFLGINNNALLVLLPGIDFTVFLRLGYIVTCWAALFGALYLHGLFPGAANRWAVRGFTIYCAAVTVFVGFAPTTLFTRYPMELSGSYILFLVYLLLSVLAAALRGKLRSALTKAEGVLLGGGMAVYLAFAGVNVYAHQHSRQLFGWEYQMVGIMVFVFLNVLALSLIFARTEWEAEKIRRENAVLDERNRLKSDVMQTISHEARTPLAVLGSYAGLVSLELRDKGVDEQTAADLDKIVYEARRVADLIDTLKLAAYGNASAREPERVALDLGALARQTAGLYRPVLARQGVALRLDVEENLPSVSGDPRALSQVLFNLLQNAKNHTAQGQVRVAVTAQAGFVAIAVSDTGSGISGELLPHVLERGIHGEGMGSGLGLSITDEVVRAHKGRIFIESEPGRGTAVTVAVPSIEGER